MAVNTRKKATAKKRRDYYNELDAIISRYENFKPVMENPYDVADKIAWCWKFRKITEEQMDDLAERMTRIFDERSMYERYF